MTIVRSTIGRKLTGAIVGTSVIVLLVVFGGLFSYEMIAFRKSLVLGLRTRAEIVAANCTAALAFRNPADATQVLAAFRADPRMELAAIYDEHGDLFARYPATGGPELFPAVPELGSRFEKGHFEIFLPVLQKHRQLGTVYLKFNLPMLRARYQAYAIELVVILLGSLLLAYFISRRLQRRIAGPILQLTDTARRISEQKDYALRAAKLSDDEIGLLTEAFNDMLQEIQKGERAVRQLNTELEQRVENRTAELEAANQELESFSYSVSHDLRAPVRAIEGFSQAVIETAGPELNDEARRLLTRVQLAAHRMRNLIEALLKLSRIGRAALRRETVDLSALARHVVLDLRTQHPDREVATEIAPGLTVIGDPELLCVLLENLLGNAWKFTSKKPDARVKVGSLQREGQTVFFIQDNGAGFNMAHADLLFTPFQRLHRQTEFEGTGVGLATVHRIILRHGGTLWAEAAVDQGATFYFTLPTERN